MRYSLTCLALLLGTCAGCTLAQGKKESTLPVAETALGIPPAQSAEADPLKEQLAQGRQLEAEGQWGQASAHYRALITAYPERYEPYHRLGVVSDHQQLYHDAQNLFGEALRRAPTNPQIFSDLGYSFYLSGEMNKAESAMLKAVQLDP